jgi:hypothetical protein
MAQKVTVILEDDLTGGPAKQTVRFAFDGTGYEIDLNAKNAAAFGAVSERGRIPASVLEQYRAAANGR